MPRIRELTIAYRPHPSGVSIDNRQITDSRAAAAILAPMLEHQPNEVFVILLVNAKRKVIAVHTVSQGGLDSTLVDAKVVFRAALLGNATGLILAHNHPSGDPTPSPDDLNLTQKLKAGAELLDLAILDHLIIGDRCYCSFLETGRL